jgi:xanthine/uracil permease
LSPIIPIHLPEITQHPDTPFPSTLTNHPQIALTRCANRKAGYAACFWLVIMGVFAKFAAALVAIPSAVLGGMTTFLFSAVAVSGIRIISTVPFTRRNRFILTAGFTLGLGATLVPTWFAFVFTYSGPNRALLGFYNAIVLVMETGFAIVAFSTLALNLILPEEVEDEEAVDITANEVDEAGDREEWERIQRGRVRGKSEEDGMGEKSA